MRPQSRRAIIQFFLFIQGVFVLFCHTNTFIALSELNILTGGYRGATWLWTLFIVFSGIYYIWKKIPLGIYIYGFYLIGIGVVISIYDIYRTPIFGEKTISCLLLIGISVLILSPFFLQKSHKSNKD